MQIITNQFQKELKQHGNEQFPFLVSYQKLSEYESGSFMWHWHPEIEITYVQKGTMCYKVNHMVYHLKEGDIVSVSVKNTNTTISQLLRNFFYRVTGNDSSTIGASNGGIVTVNGRN